MTENGRIGNHQIRAQRCETGEISRLRLNSQSKHAVS